MIPRMKVLFVIPKVPNFYGGQIARPRLPHVGIAYLSAYLKKEGHEVNVYDCNIEEKSELLFGELLLKHNVVGISLYSLNINSSYIFINKIVSYLKKYANEKVHVVLGGPHVSVTKKEALFKTGADFAIQGEGELTLSELLSNLQNENRFKQINGLIWRDTSGVVIENPPRGFIEDINTLPFPDYSVFKLNNYMNFEINEIPVNTSRGCPFDCVFCAVKLVSGKRFRPRSTENVMQEIRINYKKGIRNFYITDDAFNLNMKRAEEICDVIIKSRLNIKFVFQNGLRVDCLNQELVGKLKKAGCTAIVLPAESGNVEVLKMLKKNISVEDINLAVDMVNNANISFIVNFIIGHPTETYVKALDSIRLARQICKKKNCSTVMFFNLVPYPGTAVFEWVEKNGRWLLPKERFLDGAVSDADPIFESNEFTKDERAVLLREGNKIHRMALSRFIFGKYLGSLMQLVISIEFIGRLITRYSLSSRFGRDVAYVRFLRKLYNMQ